MPMEEAGQEQVLERMRAVEGPLDRFLFDHIAGLSAMSAAEIAARLAGDSGALLSGLDREATSKSLSVLLNELPKMAEPTLLRDLDGTPGALLPFRFISQPSESQERMPGFSSGMEALYHEREARRRLTQRAAGLRKAVKNAQERTEKKLALLEEDILTEAQAEKLRVMGELLTANLYSIPRGAEAVTLPDYYTGGELTIPIDKTLTPAANAQRYFKRYRKAHTARKLAAEQKEKALSDLQQLEEALFFLDGAEGAGDLTAIRGALTEAGLLRRESVPKGKKKDPPAQPRTYLSPEGFTVLVGRHSIGNERLLRDAAPDDLWLHAKDIPGSHVLIQAQGKAVPETTLLMAAKLAAWFSGSRGQRTRVDYTQRKYVKKTPGGAPGLVHYTGEKSLMTEAGEEEVKAFHQQ
jgi:predicted ribosome quality control (RQC) complex YloA/Tae2 family protein